MAVTCERAGCTTPTTDVLSVTMGFQPDPPLVSPISTFPVKLCSNHRTGPTFGVYATEGVRCRIVPV